MVYIVSGNSGRRQLSTDAKYKDYKYGYPEGLDLKPGSELHDDIVSRLIELANFSQTQISSQFPRWRKIDDVLTAYIKPDEDERSIKSKDSRKPISIVFPYSYAIMDSLLTYMTMAFVRDPMFKYEAVSGDDYVKGILLESVVAQHCRRSKVALKLHTLFRDSFAYSRGYAIPSWEVKKGMRTRISVEESMFYGSSSFSESRVREPAILFEGNTLYNINPYLALPDPNVSAGGVQDGEFFGWLETTNLLSLLNEEYNNNELFNVRYLNHVNLSVSQFLTDEAVKANSGRENNKRTDNGITTPVDVLYMYVTLIPSEWKLGNGNYPEKWFFGVGADSVLIRAERQDYDHNMYPIISAAPDDDGRSPTPISRLESLYGLQEVGDWLFNSHMINVRKSINNMLVVDPSMVNMNDLSDPGPGKLIRLRKPAWGRGIGDIVKQLKVDDITRNNIGETGFIQSAMQVASGTDQSMMGVLRQGGPERLTKGEFQGTRNGAMNRLERVAMIIGLQAMQDLGYFFASHTKQFMTEDTYVKITSGITEDLSRELNMKRNRVKVSYDNLLVDYDIITRDGSIPGGNFSEAWLQLYKMIIENPLIAQQFDTVRIFMHIARNLGAKNVEDFKAQGNPQVIGDEQVAVEAQKGNLIPFGAANG